MTNISFIINVVQSICLNSVEPRLNARKNPEEQKHGGCLCILDHHPTPVAIVMIGGPRGEKLARYVELSQEKAIRLYSNEKAESSWQSRNPEADQWGGAIRCKNGTILSFSGLTEESDETLMLLTARFCNLLDPEKARKIAQISNNELYPEIAAK